MQPNAFLPIFRWFSFQTYRSYLSNATIVISDNSGKMQKLAMQIRPWNVDSRALTDFSSEVEECEMEKQQCILITAKWLFAEKQIEIWIRNPRPIRQTHREFAPDFHNISETRAREPMVLQGSRNGPQDRLTRNIGLYQPTYLSLGMIYRSLEAQPLDKQNR